MSSQLPSKNTLIGHATCRETITSPAPSAGAEAIGLKPNMICNLVIPIYAVGPMGVLCQCPLGHHVHVMPEDITYDQ